ncbi:MAG: hypothetical protein L3J76_04670 [Candidatus Hydrothermae bacterium]|nr:hypothetical protein [Candidatus Hydrothermae bacterium]
MRLDQLSPHELRIAQRALRKVKGVRYYRVERGNQEILVVAPRTTDNT